MPQVQAKAISESSSKGLKSKNSMPFVTTSPRRSGASKIVIKISMTE